jgi:hypothetical protein
VFRQQSFAPVSSSAKRLPSSEAKGPRDLHVQVLRCAQDDD